MGKDVNVGIPQPFELDVDLSTTNSMNISGNMNTKITLDPITIKPVSIDMGLNDVNVDMGLDNMKVDMGLDNVNVCMSFAIKEFPSMRMTMPMDYNFGIKMMGMEVLGFSICGKSMMITEDNPKRMFYTPTRKAPVRNAVNVGDSIKIKLQDELTNNPG
jgi:hypothetical protein